MVATNSNLDEIATLARAAQSRGQLFVEFDVEAHAGFARFLELWEDTVGEVVERIYEPQGPDLGLAQPRTVKYFHVRVPVATVLEAQRRRAARELREFGARSSTGKG